MSDEVTKISLQPSQPPATDDQVLWIAIRQSTERINYENYSEFVYRVLCGDGSKLDPREKRRTEDIRSQLEQLKETSCFHGVDAYTMLKDATELFLILNCGITVDPDSFETGRAGNLDPDEIESRVLEYFGTNKQLPYLRHIVDTVLKDQREIDSPFCFGVLAHDLSCFCLLELIWSYWHEEGGLVQSMKAISRRFQNIRSNDRDPLAHLDVDPLRPLSNFIWGYIQDEPHRLSVVRRAYEYDHHYGFSIRGKAIPTFKPTDSRVKFLTAFNNLLTRTSAYYKEASDATIVPDGFPLLNALKEVHLLLAEGAHNQFRDLPYTARSEMLMEQWLLSRPEMRDFLGGRIMVPYPHDWMARVDTMKKLQRWTDTSVRHFYDLATFGERLVLSVRYGDWSNVSDANQAINWANFWKQEAQGYIHAYRIATGVDLSLDAADAGLTRLRSLPPAELLRKQASHPTP